MLQISNSVNYNKSILRRLNPSFKFILFILIVFIIFLPMGFFGQLILFAIVLTMFLLAKLSRATYVNMLRTYIIMVAMFILINWITVKSPIAAHISANGYFMLGDFLNIDGFLWDASSQYTDPNIYISTLYGGNIVGMIPEQHYLAYGNSNQKLIEQWINRLDAKDLQSALAMLENNYPTTDQNALKTILYMLNNDYTFNNEAFKVIPLQNLPIEWMVKGMVCNPQGVVVYQSTFSTMGPIGIFRALHISNKIILIILSSTILTATTTPAELTNGIEKLFKPLSYVGFPANQCALILSIGIRFIPSLLQESRRILNAQAARGLDYYNGNIIDKIKALVSLIIPLFTISIKKSDDLANAMDARAYNPRSDRTQYRVQHVLWYDYVYLFTIFSLASMLLFFWIYKIHLGPFGIIEFSLYF